VRKPDGRLFARELFFEGTVEAGKPDFPENFRKSSAVYGSVWKRGKRIELI
jgi:hypothetical protein